MVSSLNDSEFTNQLENILKSFVKEKLELIMKEELHNFLTVEHPESSNSKIIWLLPTFTGHPLRQN